jgi:hypothetical protein
MRLGISPMVRAVLPICYLINIASKIRILDLHTSHLRAELSHLSMKITELTRHVSLMLAILVMYISAEVCNLLVDRGEPLVNIRAQLRVLSSTLSRQISDVGIHRLHHVVHLLLGRLAGTGSPIMRWLSILLLWRRHPKCINMLCGRLCIWLMLVLRM